MVQVGIIPYAGVDIATFEILMESLTAQYSEEQIPAPLIVGAGMLSSCFAQCVSYPLALTLACLSAHSSGSVVDVMAFYVIIHYLSLFFSLCTGFVERNWDAFADTGSRHGRRTCEIQWHVGCNIENHTKGGFPRVV